MITSDVSIQIAASAVQVTFGLETWDYSHFSQILVYPSEYKNPKTGNMHKGETNLGGFMCFSWKDFVSGNEIPDDKINLGLHEFGHALRFNGINGAATDYFFEHYFKRWLACAVKDYSKLREGQLSIFRKYGAVNINEFFSVVIETFFEKPAQFKLTFPELYTQTSILLNQTFLEDGSIKLNCREQLLQVVKTTLTADFDDALRYNLRYNGTMFMAVLFATTGVFFLLGEGYKYPPPYILFSIAGVFWIHLERKYTKVHFKTTGLIVTKGFLFLNRLCTKTIPLSQLISLYVGYEYLKEDGITSKQISAASVTYYKDGDFYEDDLYLDVNQPQFDLLCRELINNDIHVFIKDET